MAAEIRDLGQYVRNGFQALYKPIVATSNVEKRAVHMREERNFKRHKQTYNNRNITNVSIVAKTPAKPVEKPREKAVKMANKPNSRVELLMKWKAEKAERQKREKLTAKPIFKVSKVSKSMGLAADLETINTQIKGKSFAPEKYKFKPPSNIKPVNEFHYNKVDTADKNKGTTGNTKITEKNVQEVKQSIVGVVTRARAKAACNSKSTLVEKATKSKKAQKASVQKKSQNPPKASAALTTEPEPTKNIPAIEPSTVVVESTQQKTPEANEIVLNATTPSKISPSEHPGYVSPFVTIARGKNSARKEYLNRKSFHGSIPEENMTSPVAGANYFAWRLDTEIDRLQKLSGEWQEFKNNTENLSEEAQSMIDVAIGQTNLLITKKFNQFRGLIEKCREKIVEQPVTCEDLHGFWDMLSIQVKNLEDRYGNLVRLRDQNWEEILCQPKKTVVLNKGKKTTKAKASSGLRAAIQAARKNKQQANAVKTPQTRRKSQLNGVKTGEKRRDSSPGLTMLRVSQYGKGFDTPGKSILKANKSMQSTTKSVIFLDETENDPNEANVSESVPKTKAPRRASIRLQKKLFT